MNSHTKSPLVSSIIMLFLISSAHAGPHFLPAQKYYVGDVQWFGQYRGVNERPTYQFDGG